MDMNWINADYEFPLSLEDSPWPLRAANVWIPWLFLDRLKAPYMQEPEPLEAFFQRVLAVANAGQFQHASIFRIMQHYDRVAWVITVLDENLPIVKLGALLPKIELSLTVEQYEALQACEVKDG